MKDKNNSDESTRIGVRFTHREICLDPVMGSVPILDENEAITACCLLDKDGLEGEIEAHAS